MARSAHEMEAMLLNRLLRRGRRALLQARFRKATQTVEPLAVGSPGDVELHMLFGHRHIHEVVATIHSFYRFLKKPWSVTLHEDGTVTPHDRDFLTTKLPGARIIKREVADRVIIAELQRRGLEKCAMFRRTHVLSPKLFDFQFFNRSRILLMLDTDVLCHQAPTELISLFQKSDADWVDAYNEDINTAYSWDLDTLREWTGIDVLPRVNTGLVALRRSEPTWERYEEWLAISQPMSGFANHVLEQTLMALDLSLAQAVPLPPEYDVCFRACFRGAYNRWLELAEDRSWITTQHYCGGTPQRNLFYVDFLQQVAPHLGHSVRGTAPTFTL